MSDPTLSIVTIARDKKEFEAWRQRLSEQTFDDYEICYSTTDGIPQAWNEAISKANGQIILFTETDTYPLHDDWLETVVDQYSDNADNVVHFGEFRGYNPFNFSNTAVSADLMKQYSLNESYAVGEDSELFARMDKEGVEFEHDLNVPVFHESKSTDKVLSRSFDYGRVKARCAINHGRLGPSKNTDNTTYNSSNRDRVLFFVERIKQVIMSQLASVLFFIGFGIEYISHLISGTNRETE
ncbi:hypothetical protein BVU17_08090 [Haloarcula taiwanensis]|uniref:Glycosyltransferase 2-like domain-containing protein n=1 Tax=Haloarcula taiwanensis TaxID=1932004 RepID=A0A2H4ZYH7_9EURY|nr:glycosyltransferase [Haloarcula taiwanensis]AUG47477.1 hypothetical protein BVU17_08090 [Haloarcula taiwanensis]